MKAGKAEQEKRLAELQRQRDKNLAETGYSETDAERSAREQREYEEEQARLKASEEELAEIQPKLLMKLTQSVLIGSRENMRRNSEVS